MGYDRSFVVVRVTKQSRDLDTPWNAASPKTFVHMGTVVRVGDKKRVLVPSSVIADAVQVEMRLFSSDQRWPLTRLHVDYEVNLALLSFNSDFLERKLKPIKIGLKSKGKAAVFSRVGLRQLVNHFAKPIGAAVVQPRTSHYGLLLSLYETQAKGLSYTEPSFLTTVLSG